MIVFFPVGCYLNTFRLELQVIARAKRLHNIFEWGREVKSVGNNCSKDLYYSLLSTKKSQKIGINTQVLVTWAKKA